MVVGGRALLIGTVIWLWAEPGAAAECGFKRYCKEMRNCAEATFYLNECGLTRLDGDGDGIPCEKLCGNKPVVHQRRVGAQSGQSLLPATYQCGTKRSCEEMDSCEEALFHLQTCKLKGLDADGDGRPCDGLC